MIGFRITPAQAEEYALAAEAAGHSITYWARAVLLGGAPSPAPATAPAESKIKEVQRPKVKAKPATVKQPLKSIMFALRVSNAVHTAATVRAKASGQSVAMWARDILNNPPENIPPPDARSRGSTTLIGFRLTQAQADQYAVAAKAAGCSVSCWARAVLAGANSTY